MQLPLYHCCHFCCFCRCFSLDIPSFFLLGVHIHPNDTLAELNYMEDIYRDAVKFFGISNAIIMGDMNADCSYLV